VPYSLASLGKDGRTICFACRRLTSPPIRITRTMMAAWHQGPVYAGAPSGDEKAPTTPTTMIQSQSYPNVPTAYAQQRRKVTTARCRWTSRVRNSDMFSKYVYGIAEQRAPGQMTVSRQDHEMIGFSPVVVRISSRSGQRFTLIKSRST